MKLILGIEAVGETGVFGFYLKNKIPKIEITVVIRAWPKCMRNMRPL